MSFRNLILAITFMAIFVMGLRFSLDTDSWWQLRTGELIVQQRLIPTTDSFSFTRNGQPWQYPSSAWMMELKLYLVYNWLGTGGLNLWLAAMITLAFTFIYMSMSGGGFLRVFVLILAVTVSGVYWAARPYMASFVLSAVFLWILEDFRWDRRNRLVWLVPLMLLWVNSHPGFAIGFLLAGIYFIEELVRQVMSRWPLHSEKVKEVIKGRVGAFLLVLIGMLLVVNLNPSGPAIFQLPFETVSIGVLRDYITEWQSPDFHQLAVQTFLWLLLLTIGVLGAARKRITLSDFLLLAVSTYMSLLAARNLPLFALIAPIVLTRYAVPLIDEISKKMRWSPTARNKEHPWQRGLNLGILILLFLVVFVRAWTVFGQTEAQDEFASKAPVGAVEYIKENHPNGNLFNSYNWGGYLIWNLRDYPVFVDGRTDLYGDQLLSEWLNAVGAEDGWQAILEKWDIGLVLIEPTWPLAKLLPTEGWQLLYEDQSAVLFEKPQ